MQSKPAKRRTGVRGRASRSDPGAALRAPARLEALSRLGLLDSPPDESLDELTRLVSRSLDVPVAAVSLLDDHRQFFLSHVGLPEPWASRRETSVGHSFCQHVVAAAKPLVVPDARAHPLVRRSPLVEDLGIVAYAGVPLNTTEGHCVGTLCVWDTKPRKWKDSELRLLQDLATNVLGRIEAESARRRAEQGLLQREEALRQSEERYRAFIANSSEGIWCFELRRPIAVDEDEDRMIDHLFEDGYLAECNDAMARMYGASSAAELVGAALADLLERAKPANLELLRAFVRSGFRLAGVESHETDREGRPKIFLNSFIGDVQNGQLLRAWGTQVDITALRQALESERRLEAQLRQAQKLEAVGELTAGIVHDFNNALSVILGNAQLVAESLPPGAAAHEDLRDIQAAALAGAEMVRKLLAFGRQAELVITPIDLRPVLKDVSAMLKRVIPARIQVRFRADEAIGLALADAGAVQQIILNLATNARDAMPEGGSLVIELRRIVLDREYATTHAGVAAGDYVLINVSDTGIGMDEKTKARVFEPFFTTKPPGRGSGLGLSMIYGLTKQHGGHVEVHSEIGNGTSVSVYLPAAPEEAVPITPRGSGAAQIQGGDETILLVEDEEGLRRTGQRILERFGYTVLCAVDGEEGLKMFREHEADIDLVLSDLEMPKLGGRALYQKLREGGAKIPVVFASGYAARQALQDAVIGPEVLFIEKPWTVEDVARTVRQALDRPN